MYRFGVSSLLSFIVAFFLLTPGAEATAPFADDFESGIDPAKWSLEIINGTTWVLDVRDGSQVIRAQDTNRERNNRYLDIHTQRTDFGDFVATWDMFFTTSSWHRDWRSFYFRSDDAMSRVHGYILTVGVWIPTISDTYLAFARYGPDNVGVQLNVPHLSYPWELDTWYRFKLEVVGYDFRVKVWKRNEAEPEGWTLEAFDPDELFDEGRIGFGNYWGAGTYVDNVLVGDPDMDADGILDEYDNCPAIPNPDQANYDGDESGDSCDPDDDNDTVGDNDDDDPFNAQVCRDVDADTCDDCTSGSDAPSNDGTDTDGDGLCDFGDADDDNDGVLDPDDGNPTNPMVCRDVDLDGCDDCNSGTDAPANDGIDTDGDGLCDFGDVDDDGDNVPDDQDADPFDPYVCRDVDGDSCDDCSSGTDAPANDGADFDGDALCDAGDPDDDNDGLADAAEPTYGTDPFDADSDADGLLDGTEVDIAMNTGCPDPIDFDSDADSISDGDEVTGGTNPCNADTDGDGVADNEDPLPTEPGVTSGFLEDVSRETGDWILEWDLDEFTGSTANASKGRRNSLFNRATEASNLIAEGDYAGAAESLRSLLRKVDGQKSPPDWIEPGIEQQELKEAVSLLIELLAYAP